MQHARTGEVCVPGSEQQLVLQGTSCKLNIQQYCTTSPKQTCILYKQNMQLDLLRLHKHATQHDDKCCQLVSMDLGWRGCEGCDLPWWGAEHLVGMLPGPPP